jgi:hypothetical protein
LTGRGSHDHPSASNLTQKKMEDFFHNDANFSDCTPGFFKGKAVAA